MASQTVTNEAIRGEEGTDRVTLARVRGVASLLAEPPMPPPAKAVAPTGVALTLLSHSLALIAYFPNYLFLLGQ